VARHQGSVVFASIDALVATERACVWTLGRLLDDSQFERLRHEARTALAAFSDAAATRFSMPALIVTAAAPARH
jgi:hypothetical protein